MTKLAEPDTSIPLDMVEAVEVWLREEVVPGYQAFLKDPSTGIPADQVLDRIKARRAAQNAR